MFSLETLISDGSYLCLLSHNPQTSSLGLLALKEIAISFCVTFEQWCWARYTVGWLAHSPWPLILSGVRLDRATVGYLSTGTHSPHFASPSSTYLPVLLEYPHPLEDMVCSILLFSKLYLPGSFRERYSVFFTVRIEEDMSHSGHSHCTWLLIGRHMSQCHQL